ncbi:MAG: ATP-binding protein, partial [Chitinophagales bacterium]|nr:ATP-binding protein [Chitinophagales bacterium]
FIRDKLLVIYKTIGKPHKFQKDINKALSSNIMFLAERDVGEWAIEKNKQIRELRKMDVYRKEFVGTVSHELRTPIFIAQGYIESLIDGVDDEEKSKQYLQKALDNIERLEEIVNDLIEISKLEAGRIHLDQTVFDIIALFKKVFDQYQYLANEVQSQMKIEGSYKTLYVYGDSKRYKQVIENLISNALKYGRENGTVSVRFYDLEEQIIIEISDNGPGIESESLERIFERFYRVDKHRARSMGGTGLGLSIVKSLIEAHDQNISVRSKVGEGTTFSFTIQKASPEMIKRAKLYKL